MSTVKILVPVSGGKDSQAALKKAIEHFPADEVRGLFCNTQWEHPLTYEHIDKLRDLYGVRVDTVCGGSVIEKSIKHGRFPGGGARHCTDELKIRETKIYCRHLAMMQGGFEVWYGMRSNESHERKERYAGKISEDLYHPHEVIPGKYPKYLGAMGVRFRLPVLDWTAQEVIDYVGKENLNPLYETFDRVGCFPCMAAGDETKEKAFSYDDFGRRQFIKIVAVGQQIGKPVFDSIGGKARNEFACLVCSI